jgi:hypothetical protein
MRALVLGNGPPEILGTLRNLENKTIVVLTYCLL